MLDIIRLLEAKNRSLQPENDGMKLVVEKDLSTVSNIKRKKVDILSGTNSRYFGVACHGLSDLPMLCIKEKMEHVPFATKPFCDEAFLLQDRQR